MESLQQILTDARIRPQLISLLEPAEECVLVGGALRDWLMGRPVTDFDFATPGDPTLLAQRFSRLLGGSWFVLDPLRRQSRVVVHDGGGTRTYDFAPYRGPDLEADLRGRDFTINALGLVLDGEKRPVVHDPLHGRKDLDQGRLRDCSESAFLDDPLRVLRGVRHAVTLGFQFEAQTADRMRAAVRFVREVAPERVRGELAAIFTAAPIGRGLTLLEELALLPQLFGVPGREEAAAAGMRLASEVEAALAALARGDGAGEIAGLCSEEQGDGFSRSALLKLAGCLRGYAPPDPLGVLAQRLRLSRRNVALVRSLLALPAELAAELPALPAGRGRALWADRLGPSTVDSLLFLAVLDDRLRRSPALLLETLRDHLAAADGGRIPDLVDGGWMRERLGLVEGPAVGALLERLRRAEIEGGVHGRAEAERFLIAQAQKTVDKGKGDPL